MPRFTGAVSRFHNTTITADETIGTGNGVQTVFSYNLANPTIFLDSIKIKYTTGGVQKTATSNPAGVISGTDISSGSVNEAGAVSLTFSVAPGNGTSVFVDEYKVKGFLQKLLDHCTGAQYTENIGTGNGVLTSFSATLANGDIAKGQCRIKFKIGGVVYDVWDDGEGEFNHALITSGTVNYASKAVSFTFAQAIDNGFVLPVLYSTGTEHQDWIVYLNRTTKKSNLTDAFTGEDLREVVLKNSGVGYKDEIVVGLREFKNVATTLYGLNLNVYRSWANTEESSLNWNTNSANTGLTGYDNTTNNFTSHPMTPMNNASMNYVIYVNKRRIMAEIRVSGTIFTGFYVGAGIPFASPSKYPKPYLAVGNVIGNIAYTSTSSGFQFFIKPPETGTNAHGNAIVILPDNSYERMDDIKFLPDFSDSGQMKKNKSNQVVLYPIYLVKETTPKLLLMELDGVYHAPCISLASEQTLEYSSKVYDVWQNIFRTTYLDYMAIVRE